MGRPSKQSMPKTLFPLEPLNYRGILTPRERQCVAWHILSGCRQSEAYIMFLHPEYSVSPAIASRQASEFFGAKAVLDFMADYSKLVCSTLSASGKEVEEPPRPKVQEPKTVIEKNKGETDAEYKKRRKRESVELVVDKIIDHIDEADDFDSILDTIKAMERTGFFESELLAEKPPMRYLPVTCGECEYKQFIDEQIKIGNIEKI